MITLVDSVDVPKHWREALKFLQPAFDKSPLPMSVEVVFRQLISSEMKLILVTHEEKLVGASIVILENREGTKVLHVYMIGFGAGYPLKERIVDFEALEKIAVEKGCAYITGYTEKSFVRSLESLGMEAVKVMMVKKIGE